MVESEYAKALYELAVEYRSVKNIEEQFGAYVEALNDKDFYSVLTAPNIDISKKKEIIKNVFKSFDETFVNFLYVLLDHNRVSLSNDIYDQFKKIVLENNDILRVEVFSAKTLSIAEIDHLTNSLRKKYTGKKIEVENIVKPELIGGIQIVSNGEALDISLKNSLDKLRESL